MMTKTLFWKNRRLFILNQLLLPACVRYVRCRSFEQVADAIRTMVVRGAPAIGVSAAYGAALAAGEKKFRTADEARKYISRGIAVLAATRPTAVNLFWALERMKRAMASAPKDPAGIRVALEREAHAIFEEDIRINHAIGAHGARLLKKNAVILTHCNAGALATAGYGTALGIVRTAYSQGKIKLVYVDETRPYLQGARLTSWELQQEKIPYVLITDNMAGHFMKTGGITAVIVGADRIAANGDTANKIGTYSLSVLARYHRIPFYVAAPLSTIDMATKTGDDIVIEERSSREVTAVNGISIAPRGARALHPGFDVTPAKNITAIITENGIYTPRKIREAVRHSSKIL